MSINKAVKNVQNLWHDFTHLFETGFFTFFSALAENIEKNGGKVLRDAALAAVEDAENAGGSGSDKFKAALESVISALEEEGIPIVLNAVRGAIEAAVAQFKAPAE